MSEEGRMLTTMTDTLRRRVRALGGVFLVSALIAVLAAGPAAAQRTTSKEVVDCYNEAQEFYAQEPPQTRQARDVIRRCLSGERTPDEKAVLLRFVAQLEVELDNFPQAIRDIEASLQLGEDVLSEVEVAENYFFLGRLYLGVEPPNYARAIDYLSRFISVADNPSPEAYFYLGQAQALTGRYREAIPNAQKAIELSKEPKESHYRLLLFSYAELQQYQNLVSLVERMLTLFSVKDEYLSQLAAGYQELRRERDAFLVQAFRYELGFLDSESELVGMADLYLTYENPHRGARILEKEIEAGRVSRSQKNLEKLGNMWFLAREYQEARKYLTEAASKSPKGELDLRIGQTYFEDENWSQSERFFRRALSKGGLKEPCQTRLLLAHSLNNQENTAAALEEFRRASQVETCRAEARQWVTYLEEQQNRAERSQALQVLQEISNLLQTVSVATSDAENARAVAMEAVEAAQAAVDAQSGQIRQRRLDEYERARDSVRRSLQVGSLEEARADRERAVTLIAEARQLPDLSEGETNLIDRLDQQSKLQVEAIEQAQADLQRAEQLAEQARSGN